MRVLVTGGAGFIGSHLADALLARGDDVAVVDDMSAGRPGRVPELAVTHKVSVTDGDLLAALVDDYRPDLICHLAAQIDVRVSVAQPALDAEANVIGTVNVLEAARATGATGAVLLDWRGDLRAGRADTLPRGRAAAA